MPSLTNVIGAIGATIVVSLVFALWIGWPGFLAVGTGSIFGIAFLIVSTALGDDPRAADDAWRAQAGDLVGSRANEPPDELGVEGLDGPIQQPPAPDPPS